MKLKGLAVVTGFATSIVRFKNVLQIYTGVLREQW